MTVLCLSQLSLIELLRENYSKLYCKWKEAVSLHMTMTSVPGNGNWAH